jgi:hypothetical protein
MTKPNTLPGLSGHWLFFPEPDTDNGLTGQIEMSIGDFHLVKMRGDSGVSMLLASATLCGADTYLFDTEEQLNAWLKPDGFDGGSRVVPIRKEPA